MGFIKFPSSSMTLLSNDFSRRDAFLLAFSWRSYVLSSSALRRFTSLCNLSICSSFSLLFVSSCLSFSSLSNRFTLFSIRLLFPLWAIGVMIPKINTWHHQTWLEQLCIPRKRLHREILTADNTFLPVRKLFLDIITKLIFSQWVT